MEPFIRYILMGTGFLILLFIFLNSLRNRKQQNKFTHHETTPEFNQIFFGEEEEEPEEDFVVEIDVDDETAEELAEDFEEEDYSENFSEQNIQPTEEKPTRKLKDEFIQIPVLAESGKTFGGYDLLQTLTANHFYFGDMNIFHYHQDMNPSSRKLFSLASVQKPGDFDLDRIGLFKTKGLVLFMNRADHPGYADHVYELMEEIAYQLAEDLGGTVKI